MTVSIKEAKGMIENFLENDDSIEEYSINDDGIFEVEFGSTTMSIEVYKKEELNQNLVEFRASLVEDFDLDAIDRETALALLRFNWDVPFGAVTMSIPDEDEDYVPVIWFSYSVLTDLLSEDTMAELIGTVAGIADGIDESVRELIEG
jgi:hypothetical protein